MRSPEDQERWEVLPDAVKAYIDLSHEAIDPKLNPTTRDILKRRQLQLLGTLTFDEMGSMSEYLTWKSEELKKRYFITNLLRRGKQRWE